MGRSIGFVVLLAALALLAIGASASQETARDNARLLEARSTGPVTYQAAELCCKDCSYATSCCCPRQVGTATLRKTVFSTKTVRVTKSNMPRVAIRELEQEIEPVAEVQATEGTGLEARQARNNCPVCPKRATVLPVGAKNNGGNVKACCIPRKTVYRTVSRTTTVTAPLPTLRGRLFHDRNNNRRFDGRDVPIADTRITLLADPQLPSPARALTRYGTVTTDSLGNYIFRLSTMLDSNETLRIVRQYDTFNTLVTLAADEFGTFGPTTNVAVPIRTPWPTIVSIKPSADNKTVSVRRPIVSGTGLAKSILSLYVDGVYNRKIKVNAKGRWSVKTGRLKNGTHELLAVVKNGKRESLVSKMFPILVMVVPPKAPTIVSFIEDTGISYPQPVVAFGRLRERVISIPQITIRSTFSDQRTSTPDWLVSGKDAVPRRNVTLYLNNVAVASNLSAADGTWMIACPVSPAIGLNELEASVETDRDIDDPISSARSTVFEVSYEPNAPPIVEAPPMSWTTNRPDGLLYLNGTFTVTFPLTIFPSGMMCPIAKDCKKGYLGYGLSYGSNRSDPQISLVNATGADAPSIWFTSSGTASATFKASDLASTWGTYLFNIILVSPTGVVAEGADQRPVFNITIVPYPPKTPKIDTFVEIDTFIPFGSIFGDAVNYDRRAFVFAPFALNIDERLATREYETPSYINGTCDKTVPQEIHLYIGSKVVGIAQCSPDGALVGLFESPDLAPATEPGLFEVTAKAFNAGGSSSMSSPLQLSWEFDQPPIPQIVSWVNSEGVTNGSLKYSVPGNVTFTVSYGFNSSGSRNCPTATCIVGDTLIVDTNFRSDNDKTIPADTMKTGIVSPGTFTVSFNQTLLMTGLSFDGLTPLYCYDGPFPSISVFALQITPAGGFNLEAMRSDNLGQTVRISCVA